MKDVTSTFEFDLTNLDQAAWMDRVDDIAEEHGYAEPVGLNQTALLIDGGRTLLVTFETSPDIRKYNDDQAPIGWGFVQSHGWSSLTLTSTAKIDWFRHPALFGYFDRMIDDGFFDDFDQVLFYGAGAAGYAAAAFSVAAPDAHVLLIQPQATLDPAVARWDRRHLNARRLDFSTRFGYAPMMLETAETVTVIHDPTVIEDAMHATLFNGNNTAHLTCPNIGPNAHLALNTMDVFPDLIELAMDGALTQTTFAQLWTARQTHMPYLSTLFHRLDVEGRHERLLARLCRHAAARGNYPMFNRRLTELTASGVTL